MGSVYDLKICLEIPHVIACEKIHDKIWYEGFMIYIILYCRWFISISHFDVSSSVVNISVSKLVKTYTIKYDIKALLLITYFIVVNSFQYFILMLHPASRIFSNLHQHIGIYDSNFIAYYFYNTTYNSKWNHLRFKKYRIELLLLHFMILAAIARFINTNCSAAPHTNDRSLFLIELIAFTYLLWLPIK